MENQNKDDKIFMTMFTPIRRAEDSMIKRLEFKGDGDKLPKGWKLTIEPSPAGYETSLFNDSGELQGEVVSTDMEKEISEAEGNEEKARLHEKCAGQAMLDANELADNIDEKHYE